MYLVDIKLKVNWTLYASVAPPLLADLEVIVRNPGCVTPESFSILAGDYTRPTIDTVGFITYMFTPSVKGLWQVSLLVSGTIVSTHDIFVSQNDTSITKFVSSNCLP